MEKALTIASLVLASLVTLVFVLDLAVGLPFGRQSLVLDILFAIAGGFIIWQSYDTYREFA
jgi:hypothetical protein